MAKHLTPDIYQSLLTRLSELFPGTSTTVAISTVAKDAGLDVSRIFFGTNAYSVWDTILCRTEVEEKIGELLKAVQQIYKNDNIVNSILQKVDSPEIYIATPEVQQEKIGMIKEGGKLRVFINYDKADAAFKEKLINYTLPYIMFPDPLPVVFFDVVNDMLPGDNKQDKAQEELERSDVVLLILSNDFLLKENGFCYTLTHTAHELRKVLAPIKMRPAPIERIKQVSGLKILPEDEPPLASRDEDEYDAVARRIFDLIQSLLK